MTLTAVPGIRVGHAEVPGGGSGCTVVLGPFRGAVEVRGLATGTRELDVLSPHHLVDRVNAILLTGGSAFGLAAADGVMEHLAGLGEGFETGVAPVPLVPGAVIFDLAPGRRRPGVEEGRVASRAASSRPVSQGRVGAGSGATVGKILGPEASSPGGVGSVSRGWRDGTIGVLTVVNALGDVLAEDGTVLAGPRSSERSFQGTDHALLSGMAATPGLPGTNTTLSIVATDLPLSRVDLGRVAKMAAGALPRAISPVNTPFDGDLVFAVSTGVGTEVFSPEDLLAIGVTARTLTEESIRLGVA
ncbi:MAG: P1 family peptidase [Gemmatimonadetes bacterium]|nr:P1 family peptidase [Gemmatimonadota bacterium]